MFDAVPSLLFTVLMLISIVVATGILIGVTVYDSYALTRQRHQRSLRTSRLLRKRPYLTIMVTTSNSSQSIEYCLMSIYRSLYRNYRVLIVDEASTDTTIQVIERFAASHPHMTISIYRKRPATPKVSAYKSAIRKNAKTDLIFWMDPTLSLDRSTIKNAVDYQIIGNYDLMRLYVRPVAQPSLVNLYIRFWSVISHAFKKTLAVMGVKQRYFAQPGSFYTQRGLQEAFSGTLIASATYSGDIVLNAHAKPILWFKRATGRRPHQPHVMVGLIVAQWTLLVLGLPLITYLIYVAVVLEKPELYGLSWAIFSVFLFATVLWNNEMQQREKLRMMFFVPIIFALSYCMLIVQGISSIISSSRALVFKTTS